ncbi:MAG: DNA ligase (NAD(+)) LigA [Spirochaetales bacterium]|nr:DNA ligase (NAD(+)) LigA [Spirochaetales bacterium]
MSTFNDTSAIPASIRTEAESLRTDITRYQKEYYLDGRPSMSDQEFDRIFDRLLTLESQYPGLQDPTSPTHRVGSDLSSEFPEVHHTIPVLSLDKVYSQEELGAWIRKLRAQGAKDFVLEEKLDGASVVLYYQDGVLEKGVTRGNGEVGNDITTNIRTLRTIPLTLPEKLTGPVRGEVFLGKKDFQKINQTLEVPYANPRNLAAGTLRRIKSREVAQVPLQIFVYESFFPGDSDSHWQNLAHLKVLGFPTNPRTQLLTLAEADDAEQALGKFVAHETQTRASLDYEIDGLVFKVDHLGLRESLGYTGHHPRWAMAYKFESPQGISRVLAIDVQIGRTGRVTPVARIEPVEVGGSTISNVTLHNQDYIDGLELSLGDTVAVSRRGDVIPAIESVLEKAPNTPPVWRMAESCPTCHSPLVKNGAHHFCPNFSCPDRELGRLIFFAGRDQMDIEGLGSETIETLRDQGWLRDIPDAYDLPYDKIVQLPGFGQKKVDILSRGIEDSKNRPYRQILASLGVPDLGPKVAELLIENGYPAIADLFALVDQGKTEELLEIKGLGAKIVARISATFGDDQFRGLVGRLEAAGLKFFETPREKVQIQGVFSGQTWCVTGSFEKFKPRDRAMELVRSRGGQVTSDVTSKTTHLLAGEKAGSKLTKAEKLGLTIVNEAEFLALSSGLESTDDATKDEV